MNIRGGSQPMLVSKNKKSARRFIGEDILVYLVPELCIMTGITDTMRYNPFFFFVLIIILRFQLFF